MVHNPGRETPRRPKRTPSTPKGDASTAPPAATGSRRPSKGPRFVVTAALAVAAIALGLAAWRETSAGAGTSGPVVQSEGSAAIGGPFKLVDQNGHPADQRILLGKWSAVFFGYTYCPDTCPATLQALAAAQSQLTPVQRAHFQVVFISVDPARDTPAQMKLYLGAQGFPTGAIGLTGSAAQVADVAKAYRVFYAKQGSGADYTVQHSAAIYLMDPRGQFVKPLDETQAPGTLAANIREAMSG